MNVLIKGEDSGVVANTLRRIIYQDVPHFAFTKIDIKTNTTSWHNDYLRLRVSNIPVMGLQNSRKQYQQFVNDHPYMILGGGEEVAEGLGNDVMTMHVSVKHNDKSQQFRNITTKECLFYVNGKATSNPYEGSDMLICTLRMGESLELVARTEMGMPRANPAFCSVGNVWFKMQEDGSHLLFIEPRFGVTGKEIIFRARDILCRKLQNFKERVKAVPKGGGEIEVEHDRFTLPEVLVYYMQQHPAISYCGYRCDHMLGDKAIISYRSSTELHKVMEDVHKQIMARTDITAED